MKPICCITLLLTLLPPVLLCAQELGEHADDVLHLVQWARPSGSIRAGYWSSSRTLDDQRLGAVAIKATYYLAGVALTGIWLPDFQPHTVPMLRPAPPLTIRERVPRGTLDQRAIRIEQTGQAVDWSLSYFDGFDLFPD